MFRNKRMPGKPGKKTIAIALLFSSTLAWFYIFDSFLKQISGEVNPDLFYARILVLGIFTAASGIVGSLICERIDRRRFLIIWISFGIFTSISIALFSGPVFFFILNAMIGISFGLGFPACQAFLTESVSIEKRGRAAGVTFGFTFIIVVLTVLSAGSLGIGVVEVAIVLSLLKAVGLIAVIIDPCKRESGPITAWNSIIKSREFYSYGIAWMVFQFANGITILGNFSQAFPSVVEIAAALQLLASIIAAFLGGFLADRIGRKQPMFIGLITLGASYALLSLMYQEVFVYLIYVIIEGFALGMIAVLYLQVILGDISSRSGSKERYYALGGMLIPFLIAAIFEASQAWFALAIPINWLTAILSVVILLSVIPVIRAPETLPQQNIQERKFKEHIEKVGKLVEESKKK